MAKIKYESLNEINHAVLEDAQVGDVIKYDNKLYIVTNIYSAPNKVYRGIVSISLFSFGELEYIDKNANIEILKDAEITIKY